MSETQASTTEKTPDYNYSQVHNIAKKPNPPTAAARHTAPPTTNLGTIKLPAMFLSGGGHQVAGAVFKVHAVWVRAAEMLDAAEASILMPQALGVGSVLLASTAQGLPFLKSLVESRVEVMSNANPAPWQVSRGVVAVMSAFLAPFLVVKVTSPPLDFMVAFGLPEAEQ